MYTFHRISREKIQSEVPLLVVSRDFPAMIKKRHAHTKKIQ